MRTLLKALTVLLPWPLKRYILVRFYGFELHPSAHIGLSWIFPNKLVMREKCRIDHFTVAIHLDTIIMESRATMGRSNWVTGFSTKVPSRHFLHEPNRRAELLIGHSAAITRNHHIDCTSRITIGEFATVAGYGSQFLTHSIDVTESRQSSAPISIGAYTFVGTNTVILGGSSLPARSVLGAKSLLNKAFQEEWMLYGGVPAKPLQAIPRSARYFSRQEGFVY